MLYCHFCNQPIAPDQLHHHHLVARADGGDPAGETVPVHRSCHHQWHRDQGHYAAWTRAKYLERVAMFGRDEVHRILSSWGRRGYDQLADKAAFHRAGGLARAANGRDGRGRFVPAAQE